MERWMDLGQRKQLLPLGQQFGRWSDGTEMISLALCGGDGGEGVDKLDAVLLKAGTKPEFAGRECDSGPQGSLLLRSWLSAAYRDEEGCLTEPGRLLLAGGSADAVNLLLRWCLNIGGTVLLETPASPEMLESVRQQGGQAILVPCDREGMILASLEQQIKRARPSLIYVTPRYSNPSGRVWSEQRLRELLRLAARHSLLLVEDDSAGAIPFSSQAAASHVLGNGSRAGEKQGTVRDSGHSSEQRLETRSRVNCDAPELQQRSGKQEAAGGYGVPERHAAEQERWGRERSKDGGKCECEGNCEYEYEHEVNGRHSGLKHREDSGCIRTGKYGEGGGHEGQALYKRGQPKLQGAAADQGKHDTEWKTLYRLREEEPLLYSGAEVVGIGSFQATAFPSLPVAWIRGSERVIQALAHIRSALIRRLKTPVKETAAYEQRLYALLSAPAFAWPEHAAHLAAEYAARREAVLEQLREQPEWQGASFEEPQGGLFLWLRLPPGLCSEALLRAALPKGAAFMPGARCYAAGAGAPPDGDAIRLTYAAHSAARLRRGMARIAEAIAEFTARGAG